MNGRLSPAVFLQIHGWIHGVNVALVQFLPKQLHCFTKSLEVNDLPFPQEFDHIVHVRIVRKPQDVVIGNPCLLLGSQVFRQIRHGIPLDLHGSGTPGEAGGCGRVDPHGVIHEIGGEGRILDLGILQVPGQLMDDGADHLQMTQLFRAHIYDKKAPSSEDQFKSCEFAVILR